SAVLRLKLVSDSIPFSRSSIRTPLSHFIRCFLNATKQGARQQVLKRCGRSFSSGFQIFRAETAAAGTFAKNLGVNLESSFCIDRLSPQRYLKKSPFQTWLRCNSSRSSPQRGLSVFIESINQSRRATFSLANQFVEHRLCRSFVDSQRNTNLNAVFILEPPPPFP
ncbi:MAG: hypothetical protein ACKO3T_00260, partial [Planctomycetaceae bacterium]